VNQTIDSARLLAGATAQYSVRLARCAAEIQSAQALRFHVFNLELQEGLAESYSTGLDADPFDEVCDHLLVEHRETRQVVGTYRLQTGASAAKNLGFYCAQEFEFDVFEPLRNEIIELGRACVHRQHRNLVVLGLLWKGIADYAQEYPWRTKPTAAFDCPLDRLAEEEVQIPKLLRAYLALGAKICGPPALDRRFGTIDFLTLVDLETMPAAARERFLG